ncbi:sensor domain-containing diguanylate cyclase [Psychrobacillus vulpis]|nr:sensor domain-containing diguanylate cyclase [Psychrobacillus vulpis]
MKKLTINIRIILTLISFVILLEILDLQLIEYLIIKDNKLVVFMLETGFTIGAIVLIVWALYCGNRIINNAKEKEEQYRHLIDLVPEAIFVHRDGNILYANQASVSLIGATSLEELINRNWEDLIHFHSYNPEQLSIAYLKRNQLNVTNLPIIARRLDGQLIVLEITSIDIEFNGLPAREFIARDVTNRKKREQIVKQLAFQDELTELPNRRYFTGKLEQLLNVESPTSFAIFFMDLDGFKQVNDRHGHEAGDELLKNVSQRLMNSVRENDLVARLAGDEFTILLLEASDQDCIAVAERIIQTLNKPFRFLYDEVLVTPSIGIARFPQNGKDVLTLLNKADNAMYQVKEKGKNDYHFAE